MTSFRSGDIAAITAERSGLQKVDVLFPGESTTQRAYNLSDLTGPVSVGDRVVCNTTAVELGLGTGGWHIVHWNQANDELHIPGDGHIMKLRYTSLQRNTGAAEEHEPGIGVDLQHIPVVACSLHSQVGVVAAAFAASCSNARLAYVMTDGAALPLSLSDLAHDLTSKGLLCGTVTAGHAFGGTHEAVNVQSALTIARSLLHADAIVVGMGPGVVGSGTELGNTALEVTAILHAVASLNGRAIACLRVGSGDDRVRHQGLSHHSVTALSHVRPGTSFAVGVPTDDETDLSLLDRLAATVNVDRVEVPDVEVLLDRFGLDITTMGRKPAADRAFFAFAAAAGVLAATMLA